MQSPPINQKQKLSLWPFLLIKVFTNQKQFFKNPILCSKWLNRMGLHVMRVLLAYLCAKFRRLLLSYRLPKEDRAFFNKNGYLIKENFLPLAEYEAIKKESDTEHFHYTHTDGDTQIQRRRLVPQLQDKTSVFYRLLNNKTYLNLLRYVAAKNCSAHINVSVNKLISGQYDTQSNYHTDTFHPTMKSWLFLNDISENEGPFCYIPGSHKLTLKRLILEYKISNDLFSNKYPEAWEGSCRYTDLMRQELGLTTEKWFTVKENTLVIADTFGIHRRTPSLPGTVRKAIYTHYRVLWPFSLFPGINPIFLSFATKLFGVINRF